MVHSLADKYSLKYLMMTQRWSDRRPPPFCLHNKDLVTERCGGSGLPAGTSTHSLHGLSASHSFRMCLCLSYYSDYRENALNISYKMLQVCVVNNNLSMLLFLTDRVIVKRCCGGSLYSCGKSLCNLSFSPETCL